MVVLSHLAFRMPGFKRLLDSRYVSPREEKTERFQGRQFLQSKRQRMRSRKAIVTLSSHQGGKYATHDFTRGRIDDGPLRADHRRLFMLCWTTRAPDMSDRPRSLLNGYKNFLKSPACSSVSITLPAHIVNADHCVDVSGCETSRVSLRWWQNSKRSQTIQRNSARSSVVLLKKSAGVVRYPPALPLI